MAYYWSCQLSALSTRGLATPRCLVILFLLMTLLSGCEERNIDSIEIAARGIYAASLSPHGNNAVIGSIYHGGSLWRTLDGERLYNWNHRQQERTTITATSFSPDGKWALTASKNTLVLWNAENGNPARFWSSPGDIQTLSLSKNGSYALLGMNHHQPLFFNVREGKAIRYLQHNESVLSLALSEDGKFALTGSEDRSAIFWDLSTGKALKRIAHQDAVQLTALSQDGSLAFSASKYDKAVVWKTDTGEVLGTIPLIGERLRRGLRFTAARFNERGDELITGRPDRIVQLWAIPSMKQTAKWKVPVRHRWKPNSASIMSVAFSDQKNSYYAIASNGFLVHLKRE